MNFYLSKYGFRPPAFSFQPHAELGISVVIPCFNEPDVIPTLNALRACDLPKAVVEVILVINSGVHHSVEIKAQNRRTAEEVEKWIDANATTRLEFLLLFVDDLPRKHAGVGLARKIGMDEAVHRFDVLNRDGIIVCFDADSLCDPNYLVEIEQHFLKHPKSPGCSIHYEHPLEGNEFESDIYKGITNYELHLRYYNQGLKYAGLPYAFHTVGSSMAVHSSAYQKQGGMNKRKAGEDFYFIHKIIALGGFTTLKTTRVIPSPRISDRVPFGTGKAIGDWIAEGSDQYMTYGFDSFRYLKQFVQNISQYRLIDLDSTPYQGFPEQEPYLVRVFLATHHFREVLAEIQANSKTEETFIKRFFAWFDAFKVLKFMHFMRDSGIDNRPIRQEVGRLLEALNRSEVFENEKDQLLFLRSFEKK